MKTKWVHSYLNDAPYDDEVMPLVGDLRGYTFELWYTPPPEDADYTTAILLRDDTVVLCYAVFTEGRGLEVVDLGTPYIPDGLLHDVLFYDLRLKPNCDLGVVGLVLQGFEDALLFIPELKPTDPK